MQFLICRKKCSPGQHFYVIKENPLWAVKAKKTYSGLLRGKLTLYYNQKEFLFLYQKSIFKHFLVNLPFVNLFFFHPFTVLKGKEPVGLVQRIRYGYFFNLGDAVFELRLHSGFVLSLMRNEHQIAVFSRTEDGQYSVQCNEAGNEHLGILLLCCAFFDESRMVDRGSPVTNIIPNDLYSERAIWNP